MRPALKKLKKLKEKTGSTSHLDKFRFFIRDIERKDHLPDYSIYLSEGEVVTFRLNKEFVGIEDLPRLKPETIEKARRIVNQAGTGWDFQELHTQFTLSLMSGKFEPDNADGAFINFVKMKVRTSSN